MQKDTDGKMSGELWIIYQDKDNNTREWKRAQFQQNQDKVFYTFRNSPTTKLRGYIPLDHIISIEEDTGGVFRLNIIVPGKTVELKTDSGNDRNRWIKFFIDYVNQINAEPADDILGKGKSRFKTVKVNMDERERKN